jgi:hypothetical protein
MHQTLERLLSSAADDFFIDAWTEDDKADEQRDRVISPVRARVGRPANVQDHRHSRQGRT